MKQEIIAQRFCTTIAALCAIASTSGRAWAGGPPKKDRAAPATTGAPVQPKAPSTSGDAASRKTAAVAYETAKTKFDADNFTEAAVYAQRAYDLEKLPQYGLYLARSLAETGKVLEAIRVYDEVSHMGVAGAPSLYTKAVELAIKELPEARRRLVKVQIVEPAESSGGAKVSVDGEDREPGVVVETNPGKHRIEIRWGPSLTTMGSAAAGAAPVTLDASLAEGSTSQVTVSLPGAPTGTPESPGLMAPPCQPPSCKSVVPLGRLRCSPVPPMPPAPTKPSFKLEGALALGAGVAGLGVGAVAGIGALSLADDLKRQCPGGHCPTESQSVADAAHGLAMVSTVGFAVGGGGLLAGTLLLVLPRLLPARDTSRFEIAPTFGGVAMKGEF